MKVKMLEYFQGRDVTALHLPDENKVTVLEPDQVYEVDASLGAWLVEHRKADVFHGDAHYGAQSEPKLRHDDEIYAANTQPADGEEMMSTQSEKKRGKK